MCYEPSGEMCQAASYLIYHVCRLHYPEYVGGILALTSTQMENMNGFSNLYNGWGFEDDDFYRRFVWSLFKFMCAC